MKKLTEVFGFTRASSVFAGGGGKSGMVSVPRNIIFFGLILIMLGIGLFPSCEGPAGPAGPTGPGGITPPEVDLTDPTIMTLILFQQKDIKKHGPVSTYLEGKTLICSSDNEKIVKVDNDGIVTAVGVNQGPLGMRIPAGAGGTPNFALAYGYTTINVSTTDGSYSGKIPVYVDMLGREEILTVPSIYQAFQPYIKHFGTIIDNPGPSTTQGTNTVLNQQITRHFDIVTPQNDQKPTYWTVQKNGANFALIDTTGNANTNQNFNKPILDNVNELLTAIDNNDTAFTLSNGGRIDSMITWAEGRNPKIKYHFHTIVWHEQNPTWWGPVIGGTGTNSAGTTVWNKSPLTEEQIKKLLQFWVKSEMNYEVNGQKLKDVVYSWDVVNEGILTYPERLKPRTVNGTYENVGTTVRPTQTVNGRGNWIPDATTPGTELKGWTDAGFTWRDALRYGNSDEEFWDGKRQGSAWVRALGEDGIYLVFKYARLEAPNAILYYNDYDTFRPNKAKLIYDMVNDLNAKWAIDPENTSGTKLINALGAQEHNNIDTTYLPAYGRALRPTVEDIDNNWKLWSSIPGIKLAVSEMDLRVWDNGGDSTPPTLGNQIEQAKLYGEMIRIYLKYSNPGNGTEFDRITFWGHNDMNNWMSAGRPLWFDGTNNGTESSFTWGGNTITTFNSTSYAKPAYYAAIKALNDYKAANP